jgi:hypothetical protein
MLALVGIAPFLLLLLLVCQLLWLPVASIVALARLCKRRRRRRGPWASLFFMPVVCIGLLLDEDD